METGRINWAQFEVSPANTHPDCSTVYYRQRSSTWATAAAATCVLMEQEAERVQLTQLLGGS